ncbi:MAG: type II toxin-antitoxin system HicB family antitoxin [Bryobacterales bacterium]|nr:type II toxin-antitoxin system HicB family antitoxin [Bryobacterales bacterium]
MLSYPAVFEPDTEAGGFVVTFPDVEGCVTQGENLEEAESMAEDALKCMLNYMMSQGDEIPAARHRRGRRVRMVNLPPMQSAKVELYRALRAAGVRKAELARRMGIPKANINRLFDLDHASQFDQLDQAFHALHKRLVLSVEDAA